MSELMVYKANELAVSRYDLTEHETKLILCCVSLLNPTIENPTREQRTIKIGYQEYAQMMGLSFDNAYHRLNKATSDLFKRSIEIIYPDGDIEKTIFHWVNSAKFSRKNQNLELVFSEDIIPYLFQLKKFIKYNLEHVKFFKNKYSMRVYEWLLKELTQRKTYKANIEVSINEFKFMLMLESKYKDLRDLNKKILKLVENDINIHSNMKVAIDKKGRPADTLIFQVELDKQINLINKLNKQYDKTTPNASDGDKKDIVNGMYIKIIKMLEIAYIDKITLSKFEYKFLNDMKTKYDLSGSFSWLSKKQSNTLSNIINKYKV